MTTRVIRVVVDPSGVEGGGRRVNRTLGRMDRNVAGLRTGFSSLTRLAGGFVAALGVQQLVRTADTFAQIQGQLRLVTDTTEDLVAVQSALFDVAQATRQPLEATVQLYTRLARTTEFADAELVALTETIGQTIALSQAAPESAQAALFQLGQGFAAGALRGEELNSVLEQTPELANAIARGLGVSVGQLRALGQEGELTAERIQQALANVADEVDAEFRSLPLTVGQSITQLQNAFTVFIGEVNSGVGVTQVLAQTISSVADFIANDLIDVFERFSAQINAAFITPIQDARDIFGDELGGIAEAARAAGGFVLEALSNIPVNIATIVKLATVEIASIIDSTVLRFRQFENFSAKLVALALRNEEAFAQAVFAGDSLTDQLSEQRQVRLDSIQAILDERDAQLESIDVQVAEASARRQVAVELSNQRRERQAAAAVDAETVETLTQIIDKIQQQTQELAVQTALGDGAAAAIQRYRVELELAAVEGGALEQEVRAANEALIEQQQIARNADLAQANEDFIAGLEQELQLLRLSNEERAIEANLRQLNSEATSEQVARVQELSAAIEQERTQVDALGDFLTRARENAQDTLAGFLADPLADGLDELPAKFARTLQQLAAEALASELFRILGGFFSGGGGGGFFGFLGGLFGRQQGGSFLAGQPFIAGEGGPGARPELIIPETSGRVIPAGQTEAILAGGRAPDVNVSIVNASDPNEAIDALDSNIGEQQIINVIKRRRDQIRKALR